MGRSPTSTILASSGMGSGSIDTVDSPSRSPSDSMRTSPARSARLSSSHANGWVSSLRASRTR